MPDGKMREYAKFMVNTAVNVQKGQTLIINAPLQCSTFVQLCAAAAYEAGARDVCVHYSDEQLSRLRMKEALPEVLEDVKPWKLRSYLDYAQAEGGACVLSIYAQNPRLYQGIDAGKIDRAQLAVEKAMKPWRELVMSSQIQWSVACVPTPSWTAAVFPHLEEEEGIEALWQAIYKVCRIDESGNTHKAWQDHAQQAATRIQRLQEMNLEALCFQSKNGTDLQVGLCEGHVFSGICEKSVDGVPFFANVPSEEVFTAPHRERVKGVVYSSLPYVYNGNIIEGIRVRFEAGRAVEYSAKSGGDFLKQLLEADEGATRLGEVALVAASSPVHETGLLFYNTLYDENAACHIAFGAGYPTTVYGAEKSSKKELQERGLNDSLIHEDIMVGTRDMNVTGVGKDGSETPIMQNGEWCF